MQLSNAGVHTSAGLRRHAAFKPCRPELRSRRRVVIRSDANKSGTLKLGSTPKAAGGLGGLLGTITRSIGTVSKAAAKKGPKDQRTVFLAGATGRLGARVLRELLAAGFKVRAGARNVDAAKADTDVAAQFGLITGDQLKNLSWVKLDLEEPGSIAAAIGNASKVISAVGASEGSPLDSSAPRRIDGDGNISLIEAASASGVEQFVLVSSIGTGKIGFPAVVLNLFGGVLTQKRRAEEALERSGLSYLIVRPGGMERPKDDYKLTHKLTVKRRDSTFGGQVSRLQVAELVTAAVVNPGLATNKCLELVAETTAPERSLEDLLDALPTEITKEQQEQLVVVEAQARKELESAKSALSAANEELAIAADKAVQLSDALNEAKAYEREVRGEVSGVLKEGAQAKKALEAAEAAAAKAAREEAAARAVLEAQKKAGAAGELLSAKQRQEIARQALQPPKPKEDKPKEQQRAASPFGLFAAKPATPAPAAAPAAPEKAPARPASPFGGLFGGKKQEPVQEEEEEEEEEAVAEPVSARPSSPFAGFFGGLEPVAPKQQAPAPPAAAPKAAPAAAAAKPAPARQPAAPAKLEPARQPVAAAAKPEEPKKRSGSPFAGLFGGGATLQVGDDTKVQVPDRPAAQPAAKPAAAPAKPEAPAAPAAARAAPPQADAAAAAVAAEAKRKAALEEAKAKMQKEQEAAAAAAQKAAAAAAQKAAERERALKEEQENRERAAADAAAAAAAEADALARIKREREEEARKKADAKAKAEAEARAKAKADADAAGRALGKAKAEAEQRAVEEKQRATRAAEEQKKAAAAAAPPKPAATTAGSSDVTNNVAEARAWIENWRSKPAGANNTTSKAAPPASPPAAAPGGSAAGNGNSDVSPNVLEARQWIANWRAKQQGGNSSSSGAAANGQVIDAGEIFANVGRFFGGFGGQK